MVSSSNWGVLDTGKVSLPPAKVTSGFNMVIAETIV
jgi:hypothetical protein